LCALALRIFTNQPTFTPKGNFYNDKNLSVKITTKHWEVNILRGSSLLLQLSFVPRKHNLPAKFCRHRRDWCIIENFVDIGGIGGKIQNCKEASKVERPEKWKLNR